VSEERGLARLAPDDPEAMPQLGAQQYTPVNSYFDSTANAHRPSARRRRSAALEMARNAGDLKAAGYLVTNAGRRCAIGNSSGLFAYHRSTNANYTLTVRTTDGTGSGWAAGRSRRLGAARCAAGGPNGREKARCRESGGHRARSLHGDPRAAGGGRPGAAHQRYADARSADEGRSARS
jgi:hypothetical protein